MRYLRDKDKGAPKSRETEEHISVSWQRAATAIREYDHELANSAQIKAMGWADPRQWKQAELRPAAIQLDTIIAQCKWLKEMG